MTYDVSKSGEWVCNTCGKANKNSGGWTNLLNHVIRCVGDMYEEEYDERLQPERSCITSFVNVAVKGRRICIIGLSGLSCGTYLSILPIV
jgi:BED zinc finger